MRGNCEPLAPIGPLQFGRDYWSPPRIVPAQRASRSEFGKKQAAESFVFASESISIETNNNSDDWLAAERQRGNTNFGLSKHKLIQVKPLDGTGEPKRTAFAIESSRRASEWSTRRVPFSSFQINFGRTFTFARSSAIDRRQRQIGKQYCRPPRRRQLI